MYEGGYGILECILIKVFKEQLVWVIDKWLQFTSSTMLFKTVIPLRI